MTGPRFRAPRFAATVFTPALGKIWDRLGLTESFRTLPHAEITGFDLQCEGRPMHRIDFQKGPRSVSRYVLDKWLIGHAQAAGVTFIPGTTVTALDAENGSLQTSAGEFRGRLIFGADGRNSIVARQARLMPPPRRCHRIAWQATLPAPAELDRHVYLQVFEAATTATAGSTPSRPWSAWSWMRVAGPIQLQRSDPFCLTSLSRNGCA